MTAPGSEFAPGEWTEGVNFEAARSAAMLILFCLFFFFCFSPFITFTPIQTDIQPYALILSIAVCVVAFPKSVPFEVWLIAACPVAALFVWLISEPSWAGLRSTFSYLSPLTISLATYAILRTKNGPDLLSKFVVFATYLWLFFGLVEVLFSRSLMLPLIPNLSIDQDRGVASLATEPSFYGVFCVCCLGLNYLNNNANRTITALLLFQIVFLAQSGTTLAILALFAVYAAFLLPTPRTIAIITVITAAGALLVAYVLPQLQNYRIAFLILQLLSDPSALLAADVSFNARVGHALFSVLGFIDAEGMPRGYGNFFEYVVQKADHVNFIWRGALKPQMKIMSGYGASIFELGIFGLSVPIAMASATMRYFYPRVRLGLCATLFVATTMFLAIQISLPLFGVILGSMLAGAAAPRSEAREAS